MKKTTCIVILLLALTAAACGASPSNSAGPSARSQGAAATGELPATTQLIIGTIKLEGTAQQVTKEQAVELLPLWQTMKVLLESDTAAQEEKDALIAQIQETMTAGQRQAIQAMNLTRRDMASIMQAQGSGLASNSTGSQNSSSRSSSSSGRNTRAFGPGGGFFVGGDRPPDGSFGGQNFSKEQIATAQAARQASGSSIPTALLSAVIEYLKGKAGA